MIASAQTLRRLQPVFPFLERAKKNGMSYGLSSCGYDIRIAQSVYLEPGAFTLASSVEEFQMPNNLVGIVHDKSTWARQGLTVQNTVIEPGWRGFLTLELTHHGYDNIYPEAGDPIAQVVFHLLDETTEQPYSGKYQDQTSGPVEAIFE
jgi:dCTP deaminase